MNVHIMTSLNWLHNHSIIPDTRESWSKYWFKSLGCVACESDLHTHCSSVIVIIVIYIILKPPTGVMNNMDFGLAFQYVGYSIKLSWLDDRVRASSNMLHFGWHLPKVVQGKTTKVNQWQGHGLPRLPDALMASLSGPISQKSYCITNLLKTFMLAMIEWCQKTQRITAWLAVYGAVDQSAWAYITAKSTYMSIWASELDHWALEEGGLVW